jgi:hypothetical protein
MKPLLRIGISFAAILLTSCDGKPREEFVEYANGPLKIIARFQEFHASGIKDAKICLAETSSKSFPENEGQCFLSGYDFFKLSVKWRSKQSVEISFACGTVSSFKNYAILIPAASNPLQVHAILLDHCESAT